MGNRERVNAHDFIKLFSSPDFGLSGVVGGYHVTGYVNFDLIDFSKIEIHITDCAFSNPVSIEDKNIETRLRFDDCIFNAGIKLNNISTKPNTEVDNNLEFSNCECKGPFILINSSFVGGIGLDNCTFYNKVEFYKIKSQQSGLKLYEVKIDDAFYDMKLVDCEFYSDIKFELCQFNSTCYLAHLECQSTFLYKSTFNGLLDLRGGRFNNTSWKSCIFGDVVSINGANVGILLLEQNTFEGLIEIVAIDSNNDIVGIFNNLVVESCDFQNQLNIDMGGGNYPKQTLESIEINCSHDLKGQLNINGFTINELRLSGVNSNANLIFRGVQVIQLKMEDFYNQSTLQFVRLTSMKKSKSIFYLFDSHLGKAQFLGCDFRWFDKVRIYNCYLADIEAAHIQWFLPEQFAVEQRDEYGYREHQETYRQLKQAMLKQNDKVQALEFQKEEMKYYRFVLSSKPFWDTNRFILLANWTNDFGTNWRKPVALAIGITFVFYLLIVSSRYEYTQVTDCGLCNIIQYLRSIYSDFPLFFRMFNPTRNFDRIFDGEKLSGWILFLDLFHRIVISFLIYQTINAFRKFSK